MNNRSNIYEILRINRNYESRLRHLSHDSSDVDSHFQVIHQTLNKSHLCGIYSHLSNHQELISSSDLFRECFLNFRNWNSGKLWAILAQSMVFEFKSILVANSGGFYVPSDFARNKMEVAFLSELFVELLIANSIIMWLLTKIFLHPSRYLEIYYLAVYSDFWIYCYSIFSIFCQILVCFARFFPIWTTFFT